MHLRYLILFICFVQVLRFYYADGKSLIPLTIPSFIPSNQTAISETISSFIPSNGVGIPESIQSLIPPNRTVIPDCYFGVENVSAYLYTQNNRVGRDFTINNLRNDSIFDESLISYQIVVLIHGFLSSANNSNYKDMTDALLNQDQKIIVISIDWKEGACNGGVSLLQYAGYFKAVENTRKVGQYVANFIKVLVEKYNVSMENIRVIGHSLGAHIAGFVGKEVQKLKLGIFPLIVGLDPAGPFFYTNDCSERLCKTDAVYVEALHTSVPLGIEKPIGTSDLYFNNGISQPSCNVVDVSCSHSRAVQYFTECIKRECCFIGILGNDRSQSLSTCTKDKCVCVGLNISKYPARGKFYVPVKREFPYCNNNGTVIES